MPVHCDFDITQRSFNFPRSFIDRPRLAHGLREIDVANNANIRVSSTFQNLTKSSADCSIITWGNTILWSAVADVFAIAPGDLEFLTGEHMRSTWKNPNSPASVRIDFERPFPTPPKVVVFFNCIELERFHNWRLRTTATGIDAKDSHSISRHGQTLSSMRLELAGLPIPRIVSTFSAHLSVRQIFVPWTNRGSDTAIKFHLIRSNSSRHPPSLSP